MPPPMVNGAPETASHLAAVEQAFAAAPASWNPAMYYDYGLAGATLEMVSGPIG